MCLTLLNVVIIIIIDFFIVIIIIIVMNINIITPLFYKYWFLIELINRIIIIQWNLSFGTPLSIQGTQNLSEDKYSHNLLIYYLC